MAIESTEAQKKNNSDFESAYNALLLNIDEKIELAKTEIESKIDGRILAQMRSKFPLTTEKPQSFYEEEKSKKTW